MYELDSPLNLISKLTAKN